jgi:hypothetical protein
VSHGRYVIFQIAEFAVARQTFQEISPAEFKNPSKSKPLRDICAVQ